MAVQRHNLQTGASTPEDHEARLRLLIDTGLTLAGERNLETILQVALDAARELACACFGVFFYDTLSPDGGSIQHYKLSAEDPAILAGIGHVPRVDLLSPGFYDDSVFRSDDITHDSRFDGNSPFSGTPLGHLAVRSYLAVRTRTGDHLGVMLFGHPDPDVFTPYNESQLLTIAAQACAAIENARLAETLTQEIALTDSAQRASADSSRRLRQALDAAQLGTWSWNRATDMLDLDERAAELLDADPHVPISRTELRKRIVHEDDIGMTAADLRDVALFGATYGAEYRVKTRDGQQRWISSRGTATFDDPTPQSPGAAPQESTGMIGTVQDITARKTQEATLRQTEKLAATGRLAATIAHEINNPLEAVTNLIYLSKTDPGVPPPIQHLLETADNELARVAQIAQQTLGFYRDTTRPTDIDLTALLEGVVNLFSRKCQYKRLECKLDVEPDLHIFGLQGEVRQVFSNLLVNAIDASSKGVIQVRARRRTHNGRPGVSVLIADQGSGIPASVRERLFSPFFTTKESVGTGLGLWVTRGIVEKQGGTIRFRTSSEKPSGTIFRVFLPAEFLSPNKFIPTQSRFLQ